MIVLPLDSVAAGVEVVAADAAPGGVVVGSAGAEAGAGDVEERGEERGELLAEPSLSTTIASLSNGDAKKARKPALHGLCTTCGRAARLLARQPMTNDQWASWLSGKFHGWIRSPSGQWEDFLGSVKIACEAGSEGNLAVSITSIEYGTWTGIFRSEDMAMTGSTGQGDTYFRFVLSEMGNEGTSLCRFTGGIFSPPAECLFEVNLNRF